MSRPQDEITILNEQLGSKNTHAAPERLRLSFTRFRRKLRQTNSFQMPARLSHILRARLSLRVQVSSDLSTFSVSPELNEIRSQKLLALELEKLHLDSLTGIAMLAKNPIRFTKPSEFAWLDFLKEEPWLELPIAMLQEWIEYYYEIPVRPRLTWNETAEENQFAWSEATPMPKLRFEILRNCREGASLTRGSSRVVPVFVYPNFEVTLNDRSTLELFRDQRRVELRNRKIEEAALLALFLEDPTAVDASSQKFGFVEILREKKKISRLEIGGDNLRALLEFIFSKANSDASGSDLDLLVAPKEVLQLQGRRLCPMKELRLSITSGTSGALVCGGIDFGGSLVPIQELLPRLDFAIGTVELNAPVGKTPVHLLETQAIQETAAHILDTSPSEQRSERSNEIEPSEIGYLTTRALARLAALVHLGTEVKTGVRFALAQIPILAALFAGDALVQSAGVDALAQSAAGDTLAQSAVRDLAVGLPMQLGRIETKMDAPFRAMVEKFISHRQAKPKPPPASFKGTLRHYQEEGFGWLSFLADTGFGGILADDMGLGKTVQLIAHLTDQYVKNPKAPLSLVVLPKSLLFNWEEEIRKFSPALRCAIYEGSQKRPLFSQIRGLNVLLVTYNTLRQDIETLSAIPYHFVILDEAQAIKNANSQVHRACLQLKARHRLAVSGTPVENSVMDLFAIFDFVSPGLLSGRLKQKALQLSMQANGNLAALGLALKPFILRRTKEEVLKDLPPKIEKVIHCKLSGTELKRYQAIRDFHKKRVQDAVASQGLTKSGFAVLEGLLRLRQAASHPGLVDKKWLDEPRAKLDAFMEQLQTVLDSGHKALVFSQFTGLLDIVERKLERAGINQLRIDGSYSSAQRRESVHEFQSNDKVEVFLISLKAGGTGLNLTAADYVFILDPWWNPAAESQAIDRAHRMGQKNRVFAYRMITKGTVEEKILELQKTKRDLASALVSSDAGMLKTLSHQDIEALFS